MRPSPRLRAPVSLAVILSGSLAAGLGLSGCTEQGSGAAASVSTPTSVGPLGSATPAATGTSAAPTPSGAESAEGAAAILGKVLADQPVAITASGAEGPFKRGDVYVGTAFHVAEAQAKLASTMTETERADLALSATKAVVLAVSRGAAYPRTIIAAATKAKSGAPVLLLLTTPDAATPYKIAASTSLLAGATVGQFDTVATGSPAVTDGPLAVAPDALLAAYAASLAYPTKTQPAQPFAPDSFAAALLTSERNQVKAFARGTSLTSVHTPTGVLGGLRMPAGKGALVFVAMERKDVLTETTANSLTPTPAFTVLSGKSVITSRAELRSLEIVAFTVPESGPAQAVAADDQLFAASGS